VAALHAEQTQQQISNKLAHSVASMQDEHILVHMYTLFIRMPATSAPFHIYGAECEPECTAAAAVAVAGKHH
jgi:hypothetical protein